jgi:hypothetical protein
VRLGPFGVPVTTWPTVPAPSADDEEGGAVGGFTERGNLTQCHVRLEVFTAVTMKNAVFWDVRFGSCKDLRFGGT